MGSASVRPPLASRLSGLARALGNGPGGWFTRFVDQAEEIWADDLFLLDDEDDLLIVQ